MRFLFFRGLHVRHGEVRALGKSYEYTKHKAVFDFQDYFAAAEDLSRKVNVSPTIMYLATDSTLGGLQQKFEQFCNSSSRTAWFSVKGRAPKLLALDRSRRYRAKYGSHIVATNGGCVPDELSRFAKIRCVVDRHLLSKYERNNDQRLSALPTSNQSQSMLSNLGDFHKEIERKDSASSLAHLPIAKRLMLVIFEAIEDLYLLSKCERLIATSSSHYGTIASLLILGSTQLTSTVSDIVTYLDRPGMCYSQELEFNSIVFMRIQHK